MFISLINMKPLIYCSLLSWLQVLLVITAADQLGCGETIESSETRRSGFCTSGNFPRGYMYPPGTECEYLFVAQGQERVQLNFTYMDLHFTGSSASDPFSCESEDRVTVYVQLENEDWQPMDTYCGKQVPRLMMSTGRQMKVIFTIESTHGKDDQKGFKLQYHFRTDFAISGTGEQDQREAEEEIKCATSRFYKGKGYKYCLFEYKSTFATSGTFTSPNYPGNYPGLVDCTYTFHGVKGEKVNITFDVFELSNVNSQLEVICTGFTWNRGKHYSMANNLEPDQTPGYPASTQTPSFSTVKFLNFCTFMFRSRVRKHGYFTSPNYGGQYPRNTECQYIFFGRRNERVEIHFPVFEVDGIVPRCDVRTDSDRVSFSNFIDTQDTMLPTYCGTTPRDEFFTSDGAFFKVTFKSNEKYDAKGFVGKYNFISAVLTTTPGTGPSSSSPNISSISTAFIVTCFLLCKTVITISS